MGIPLARVRSRDVQIHTSGSTGSLRSQLGIGATGNSHVWKGPAALLLGFPALLPHGVNVIERWFRSNVYSAAEQKKNHAYGEKVFYYRAARLMGDVVLTPSAGKEFNWVSLKEFPEYFHDEKLLSLFNRVLESTV